MSATSVSFHAYMERQQCEGFICVVRGEFKWEAPNLFEPESWRGALQPLVHGKVREGETVSETLARKLRQEAGDVFAGVALTLIAGIEPLILNNCAHWGALVTFESARYIQLPPSTAGPRFVAFDQLASIVDLKTTYKKTDIVPSDINAMFSDDAQIMRRLAGQQ